MENENVEVAIVDKKRKKPLVLFSICFVIIIALFMFFSNYVSKDKIKITQTKTIYQVPQVPGSFISNEYRDVALDCILVENKANCVVDYELKCDFYDKNNNWLGDKTYAYKSAPRIKSLVDTWLDVSNNLWADDIAWAEYKVVKCKKSKGKILDVGFSKNNDITVNKTKDKITYKNNTKHDIKGEIILRELYYLNNGIIEENNNRDNVLIPANKTISRDLYSSDEKDAKASASEKTETFLYGYAEEK